MRNKIILNNGEINIKIYKFYFHLKSNSHAQKIHACKYTPVCMVCAGFSVSVLT